MVVAIVTHTGLALGIATVITNWSGGQMLPALLALAVATGIVCAIPTLLNAFPVRLLMVGTLSGLGFWRFFKKRPAA
ncbi:MAG: hypothetical protein RQ739_13635 [Desulfotignum sp.]|nr:hypothetical protein [Desulfotignum sp.]